MQCLICLRTLKILRKIHLYLEPAQASPEPTRLSWAQLGDDGDDGGEEQDTGKTRQQVEEHLGIKFVYIRGLVIENHP